MLTERDVISAMAGKPAGLKQVYEELAPSVVGYLASHGSDDPEGLSQDVFLALLPCLEQLEGGLSGLRTLTFSIAHARLVDETRRRARRPAVTSYESDEDPRATASAEEVALRHAQTDALIEMLRELGEDQRTVVALRVVGQLSLEETAEVIGKSVGSVKQLQRRGLMNLRDRVLSRKGVTQ